MNYGVRMYVLTAGRASRLTRLKGATLVLSRGCGAGRRAACRAAWPGLTLSVYSQMYSL